MSPEQKVQVDKAAITADFNNICLLILLRTKIQHDGKTVHIIVTLKEDYILTITWNFIFLHTFHYFQTFLSSNQKFLNVIKSRWLNEQSIMQQFLQFNVVKFPPSQRHLKSPNKTVLQGGTLCTESHRLFNWYASLIFLMSLQ